MIVAQNKEGLIPFIPWMMWR